MVRCAAIAAAARFLGAAGSAAAGAAQATRLTIITVLAGRHGPPSPSKTQDPKWTPNFSNCWSAPSPRADRKSTRLNSSHLVISYAVFCLKKKKKTVFPNEVQELSFMSLRDRKSLAALSSQPRTTSAD